MESTVDRPELPAVVVTPDTTLRELTRLLERLEAESAEQAAAPPPAGWPYEPAPDVDEDTPLD